MSTERAAQAAQVLGHGNTIVQILGDGNTVVLGHAHLTLTRFASRGKVRQDLDLLSPYSRSSKLVGRNLELESLAAFLKDPRAILVRVMTGSGGSGKTRLALELVDRADREGWDAGFVAGRELKRFAAQQNLSSWGWRKPTLVVVDYAAGQIQALKEWMDELADRVNPPPYPLRMLLLERHADTESGWWAEVFSSGGWVARAKRDLLEPADPVQLRSLGQLEDRAALLQDLVKQVAVDPSRQIITDSKGLKDCLAATAWAGEPLYLMMAALEIARTGNVQALSLGRTDLAFEIARREMERVRQLAISGNLDPKLAVHLVACVTLAQGMDRTVFESFSLQEKHDIGRPSGGDPAVLADSLQDTFPRQDGIAPVLPDLIGEALMISALPAQSGVAVVVRCLERVGFSSVVESTIRCVQDFGEMRPEPLLWLRGILNAAQDDFDAVESLSAMLPPRSALMREFNVEVAQRLCDLVASGHGLPEDQAASFHGLGMALGLLGNWQDALVPAEKAVEIYRRLAAKEPGRYLLVLTISLTNVVNCLHFNGRIKEAIERGTEAIEMRRLMAKAQPDVLLPYLAMSLNNLSTVLDTAGEKQLALEAINEAVDLREQIAAKNPELPMDDLAMSLSNQCKLLSEMGQSELAIVAAQRSVEIRRDLAIKKPDTYQADLGMSLSNLAASLAQATRFEHAQSVAKEAAYYMGNASEKVKAAFGIQHARSLGNLARILQICGEIEAATAISRQAVDLSRLTANPLLPGDQKIRFAALDTLTQCLEQAGSLQEALEIAREAECLCRKMPLSSDTLWQSALAQTLVRLARIQLIRKRWSNGLSRAAEARSMLQALCDHNPKEFLPGLWTLLMSVVPSLAEIGNLHLAAERVSEAVQIQRQIIETFSDASRVNLAATLLLQSDIRIRGGSLNSAMAASREAICALCEDAGRSDTRDLAIFKGVMHIYVHCCRALGLIPEERLLSPVRTRIEYLSQKA